MTKIFTLRNALTLLGALLIGALGSGLWEAFLKPVFSWFGSTLLDVATLGEKSLVDGIYVDVAKGSHERAAVAVFGFIMIFAAVAGFVMPLIGILFVRDTRKRIFRPNAVGDFRRQRRFLLRTFPKAMFAALVMQCLFSGTFIIEAVRLNYVTNVSNFLEQCQHILAPSMTEDQRLQTASSIARMRSRTDFIKVVSDLRLVADANKIDLPAFNIF